MKLHVYLRPYGCVLDDVLRDEPLAQLLVALHLGIGLEQAGQRGAEGRGQGVGGHLQAWMNVAQGSVTVKDSNIQRLGHRNRKVFIVVHGLIMKER